MLLKFVSALLLLCTVLAEEDANQSQRLNVSWTPQRHALLMEKFGGYVDRTQSKPFPSKKP